MDDDNSHLGEFTLKPNKEQSTIEERSEKEDSLSPFSKLMAAKRQMQNS